MHIVSQCPATEIARDILRRAAAGAGIDHHVLGLGVSLQKIPDDVAGRRAFEAGAALLCIAIILRWILPQCRRLNPQRRPFEFHRHTTISRENPVGTCVQVAKQFFPHPCAEWGIWQSIDAAASALVHQREEFLAIVRISLDGY